MPTQRKATRDAGPALIEADEHDDDIPARDELIEALVNLRVKSEAEYQEWRRLQGMNYINAAADARAKWDATNRHLNNMLDGVTMHDIVARSI